MIASTTQPDPKDPKPISDPKQTANLKATPTGGQAPSPESLVFPEETELSSAALISIAAAVTLLLVVVALFGWRITLSRNLAGASERVAAAQSELARPDIAKLEEQAADITAGLSLLSENLSTKPTTSLFLKKLQSTTHKDVRFTNLALDLNNIFKVDGEAKTYQAVAKELASLKASGTFFDVLLISASQSQDIPGAGVAFSLQATLIPEKLVSTK
jgi:Tfp pilus assembly protein PilN